MNHPWINSVQPMLSETLASPRFQLFATAVFSGATVAAVLLGYQTLEREERVYKLKNSIPIDDAGLQTVSRNEYRSRYSVTDLV